MNRKKLLNTAFPDELKKVSSRKGHFRKTEDVTDWTDSFIQGWSPDSFELHTAIWRKVLFAVIIIISFSFLFFRIFQLQIVQGVHNRELADFNRIQIKIIHAPRGVIYDRNGVILAQNNPGYRLIDATSSGHPQFVSRDEALRMEIQNDPNLVHLELDSVRAYPYKEKVSHILGYVGEINEEELKDPQYKDYRPGDKMGRGGVEETYEKVLRGVDGGEIIEVDSQGMKIRTIRETPAIPGSNIYLSIDMKLQERTFEALKKGIEDTSKPPSKGYACCGAAVAEDPNSGQLLALVSYPSYDPDNLDEALTSAYSPMLNRAIGGVYPPGSTFKIVSSLAGLTSGRITPSTVYEDTGIMSLGPYTFANWYYTQHGGKEGAVNLFKALQRSNDIYYYQLGATVGEEQIAQTARKMGLGSKLGIDIPGEVAGVIPDRAWKEKNMGEIWFPGDTLHMAIGQGFTLSTPLQISNMTSIIAANGREYPPHVMYKITSPQGATIKEYSYNPTQIKDFSKEQIKSIQQGLEAVPKSGGTAWPFFSFTVPTAGKTGTAEFGDIKDRTHAWYTSYAPVDNPEISLTVLVEAGEGSSVAGPISKDIYTWYFNKDKNNIVSLDKALPTASSSAKMVGD